MRRARAVSQNSGRRPFAHRSFRPFAVHHMYATTAPYRPAMTQPDTCRDEKETALRAAFPQRAGRFTRWWQVQGSNLGRRSRRFYSRTHRGWSRAREMFGGCGRAAGGVTPVGGAAFGVRAGIRVGLDGGGLPVTPTGLWDLSPFYSLTPGPDPRVAFCCRERAGETSACVSLLTWSPGSPPCSTRGQG